MKKLDECEVAQLYKNKTINFEKLLEIFTENGDDGEEYVAYLDQFDNHKCSLFKITSTLSDRWGYYGILFSILLNVEDNKVYSCELEKYRETGGYHGRPQTHVLTPTQQELRIFRRIMDYVTN